jgi:NitT/TauT family transport system ATP-binding protein
MAKRDTDRQVFKEPNLQARQDKITFNDVSKEFTTSGGDTVVALRGLDLALADAEVVSIVGPSGCGKSTALNLIAGFEQPTSGSVLLDGLPVSAPGPDRAVVFQSPALFPWLTVFNNVTLGVKSTGMAKSEYTDRAAELLEAVSLSGFEHAYPYQLSGGMQQRVGIARALIGNPEVLLMDEPFGALDFQTRILMQELLLELWERFRPTIFFITHDVGEAIFLSDRAVVMSRRPGTVKVVRDVAHPKPRSIEFLTSTDFKAIEHDILAAVREEVAPANQDHKEEESNA